MKPEGGYRPGATEELLFLFGILLLIGVLLMILDYVLLRKRQQPQQQTTTFMKSISSLKLTGLLITIFGAFGMFIAFCYAL